MPIECNIVQLPELRICDAYGFTNVILAQPGFIPHRSEETGYGPADKDLAKIETFVDDCLLALVESSQEHNLVVFPEAFIPISRIQPLIDFVNSDCPANTVIIAGITSLSIHDVLEADVLHLDKSTRNSLEAAVEAHHKFINACLILIRDRHGVRHLYVQPKINPSHMEQSLPAMLTSNTIFFFTCPQFSFSVITCSDFIQSISGAWLPVLFIDALQREWDAKKPATSLPVDMLVNIQCNPKPNHHKFKDAASALLRTRKEGIRLNNACVLISNWGGFWDGKEPILSSAILYQAQFWQPPPRTEVNIQCSYSLTHDPSSNLNIAAIRSGEHGRSRFRMLHCSHVDQSDPSQRFPLRDCYFELWDHATGWICEQKSAWHDRCERWLPGIIPGSSYAQFWSTPNSIPVQAGIHQKYISTRQSILGKSDSDLKQDYMLLALSSDEMKNPDTWGEQEKIVLIKWASLLTLFHYDDKHLSFTGDEWFSISWRTKVCIAFIDGHDTKRCDRSMDCYYKRFGRKFPQDPTHQTVALVLLYRHTHDSRQVGRKATLWSPENCTASRESCAGVRNKVLTKNTDNFTNPKVIQGIFWCTASDFDQVLEADSDVAFRAVMEDICEPALD